MREIKFRVWRDWRVPKMMYEDDLIQSGWDMSDFQTVNSGFSQAIVMQYTGLKDRNGKEIYEGDFLKDGGVIGFDDGKFYMDSGEEWGWIPSDAEIIGNIYENPELLED